MSRCKWVQHYLGFPKTARERTLRLLGVALLGLAATGLLVAQHGDRSAVAGLAFATVAIFVAGIWRWIGERPD